MVPAAVERGVAGPASTASRAFRHSPRDIRLVAACTLWAALGVAAIATARPVVVAAWIALCVWYVSNTIAHVHLHTPLFRSRRANGALSTVLTAITGIPQSVWRARHLWHHAGEPPSGPRWPAGREVAYETAIVVLAWCALAAVDTRVFLLGYVPGWLAGLALCALHGRGEHVGEANADGHRPPTVSGTSCRGARYNRLWFNDGFHAEHHREPGRHWTALPAAAQVGAGSRWPPVIRGLIDLVVDRRARMAGFGRPAVQAAVATSLGWLERVALLHPRVQAWLVEAHRDAFAQLLVGAPLPPVPHVVIVGGGLFPRTYLALVELLPAARFEILDRDPRNLAAAERFLARPPAAATARAGSPLHAVASTVDLDRRPPTFRAVAVRAGEPLRCDVVVVPLAFVGRRERVYDGTMAPIVLVHDWHWRRRGDRSVVVSAWLAKRLNAVVRL